MVEGGQKAGNKNGSAGCLSKVRDKNGVIQSGVEAVKVWSDHFKEVLQGGEEPLANHSEPSERTQGEQHTSSLGLDNELTHEEAMWALGKAKK